MTRKCKECGDPFEKSRRNQQYCSARCRNRQNSRIYAKRARMAMQKIKGAK